MHSTTHQPARMVIFVVLAGVATGPGAVRGQAGSDAERDRNPSAVISDDLAPQGPMPPPGFLAQCIELIKHKRYAEARMRLAPVVAEHPGWARAHLYLGITYLKENRDGEARPYFERALELDPQQDATRIHYGWCLYSLGDTDAARKMFESYPQQKAGFAEASFALGLIDFDADDLDSAKVRFDNSIVLAQRLEDTRMEAKARARLADVFIRRGNLEESRTQLERSLQLNPDNYEAWFKLSRVLERLGDADGAEQARRKHEEIRERRRPSIPRPAVTDEKADASDGAPVSANRDDDERSIRNAGPGW
ncbi:MAG: tetratricopeptide repeat protein [Planctomycetes bacterium]|nr:tetratricopeptide repeat protein [Planctomycetota bacterium]